MKVNYYYGCMYHQHQLSKNVLIEYMTEMKMGTWILQIHLRCIHRRHGNIMRDEFTPYPKNPLIQQFFANIGRTDTIGSGVRNLYKYTPMYSDGGKPELIEDDVFRINIPLDRIEADEAMEQKTLSERKQKIYKVI